MAANNLRYEPQQMLLLAEPPNGWIKNVLSFRQFRFSLRRLHPAQAEWQLVCMALNLRRTATMQVG